AAAVTAEEAAQAGEVVAAARTALRERVGPGTAVLAPATSTTAPPVEAPAAEKAALRGATLRLTYLAGLGGLPSAVAPAGLVGGHPAGVALLGAPGADTALTGLLAGWDRAL
ncbi:amidase, partial [Klenkia sp. PcliD-1-E]|nr:amidase [Klenkia sp. PcliD-1-E]